MFLEKTSQSPPQTVDGWISTVFRTGMAAPRNDAQAWCGALCTAITNPAEAMACIIIAPGEQPGTSLHACSQSLPEWAGEQWAQRTMLGGLSDELSGLFGEVAGGQWPGGLRLAVAGTRTGWVAPEHARQGLGLLVSLLSEIYARDVLGPMRRRGAILRALQPAQREIVPLLATGLTQPEIAEKLERSRHTVHDHTKRIYKALSVHSRVELAAVWFGQTGEPERMG